MNTTILCAQKNFFSISHGDKEIYFKSIDWGGNSSLALKIANDKELSHILLEKNNFPVARSLFVRKTDTYDVSDFSFPLVIKPDDGGHGDGVVTNITSMDELDLSLESAFSEHRTMIVQEQIFGDEVRVLVVGDAVVCCKKRVPAHVYGDGVSTIAELIDRENENPLRGNLRYDEHPLSHITVSDRLRHYISVNYSYTLDSVPEKDAHVQLLGISNIGAGGVPIDVSDSVCDVIKDMCVSIAHTFGLAVAGIDILSSDFSKPLEETGGVILEVGATPGIGTDKQVM